MDVLWLVMLAINCFLSLMAFDIFFSKLMSFCSDALGCFMEIDR